MRRTPSASTTKSRSSSVPRSSRNCLHSCTSSSGRSNPGTTRLPLRVSDRSRAPPPRAGFVSSLNRIMSLYGVQKLIFQLNRDPATRKRYEQDFDGLLAEFELSDEELQAIRAPDIGLLYVMGVNGQLL